MIRRATPDDAAALAELASRSFVAKFGMLYPPEVLAAFLAENYSEQRTLALIDAPALAVWLIDQGGLRAYAVLGPCKLPHPDVTPGCIELRRLYTAPDATGLGLGAQLMDTVAIPAFEAARGEAWLGVYSENPGAQRFYARYGFVKVGEYEFPVGPVRDREFILRRRRA
jgi:ribosomal protein S18 acetylase RimI-like enzyme